MSRPVVMDITSSTVRVGFAGEESPVSRFPCRVARQRKGDTAETILVGENAVKGPGLKPKYPVHCGVILNWDDMEQVFHYVYDSVLSVPSESQPLFITQGSSPTVTREKLTMTMFETFNVPFLYVASRDMTALFDSSRTNGYALHCGAHISTCIPIYEGHAIPHGQTFSYVAGEEVTWKLYRALDERNSQLEGFSDFDSINIIKEKMCYVATDYQREVETELENSDLEKTYELPDGKVVTVGSERFKCPEVLFQPILLGHDREHELGIHKLIQKSFSKYYDEDMNIDVMVHGGTTLLPGFFERLKKELDQLSDPRINARLISPRSGQDAAWVGGSMIASLPSTELMYITKEEYEEFGPRIIDRKCF